MIGQIQQNILDGRADPHIRAAALQLTSGVPVDPRTNRPNRRDFHALALAVYRWMVANIEYVRDPMGMEQLQTAPATLRRGSGDCDDHTTLGGALLASLGVPVQVRVVGATSQPSHIFLEYMGTKGQWTPFDTTIAQHPGALAARAFVYDRVYALEPGGGIGAPELGLRPRDDFDVWGSPPMRGGEETIQPVFNEPITYTGGGDLAPYRAGDGISYTTSPLPGGAVTKPTASTLPETSKDKAPGVYTSTPTGTTVSPGNILGRVTDTAETVADILRRARDAYNAATTPTLPPPPPENPHASALGGVLPLVLLGGGALLLFPRRRS